MVDKFSGSPLTRVPGLLLSIAILCGAGASATAEQSGPQAEAQAVAEEEIGGFVGAISQSSREMTEVSKFVLNLAEAPPPRAGDGFLAWVSDTLREKWFPGGRHRIPLWAYWARGQLQSGFLLQTPNVWGQEARKLRFFVCDSSHEQCDPDFLLPRCSGCADQPEACQHLRAFEDGSAEAREKKLCIGHSERFLDEIYDIVAGAQTAVEVTGMSPAADQRFLATLRNAVTALARTGRPVTIRVLFGHYPTARVDTAQYARQLVRDARAIPGSRIEVYVGATMSCVLRCGADPSWNHAKIVAADGRVAIVGGHNLWTRDYLLYAPPHDVSMKIGGATAYQIGIFADLLWKRVCDGGTLEESHHFRAGGDVVRGCLASMRLPRPDIHGDTPMMLIGRLGSRIDDEAEDANASDLVRLVAFHGAHKTLRLSQQDLGMLDVSFDQNLMNVLAEHLLYKGDIFVVLTNPRAQSGSGQTYWTYTELRSVLDQMRRAVLRRAWPPIDNRKAIALVCDRFHLATIRFGPDEQWPELPAAPHRPASRARKIANHAKVWIVDDRAAYIGSHNLYPANLQEIGVAFESRERVAELVASYWDPLWQHSARTSVSGRSGSCILSMD